MLVLIAEESLFGSGGINSLVIIFELLESDEAGHLQVSDSTSIVHVPGRTLSCFTSSAPSSETCNAFSVANSGTSSNNPTLLDASGLIIVFTAIPWFPKTSARLGEEKQ